MNNLLYVCLDGLGDDPVPELDGRTPLEAAATPVRRIGQLVDGRTVVCRRDGEPFTPAVRGYRHF